MSVPNFCYEPGHQPRFPNLMLLDLSDNLIAFVKEIPFHRNCFPKLPNLSLGFNKIKTLGKNFINHMPSIMYLSIENLDPGVTLHDFSLNSSSLQYLYMGNKFNILKNNQYIFLCKYTRNLRVLDMTGIQFVLSHNLKKNDASTI